MEEVKITIGAMKKECENRYDDGVSCWDCMYLAQCQALTALHSSLKVLGEYYTKPMYVLDEHDITAIEHAIGDVKEVFGI